MKILELRNPKYKLRFNKLALHPLQTWEWGEFRKKTGLNVERWGIFDKHKLKETLQITIHKIPRTNLSIGYAPKCYMPTRDQLEILKRVAKKHNCVFIKLEPNVEIDSLNKQKVKFLKRNGFVRGRSLFTKYNFVLDVTPNEDDLLKKMKSKTRYNIRVARRKGVKVYIDNSDKSFERYISLMKETTERQGFYARTEKYHRTMWNLFKSSKNNEYGLKVDLLVAEYNDEIITTWMLFWLNETMYYPYGASTREYRNVMANNLVMWEAIRLAKQRGCKYFDMWGALGNNPDKNNPWYGFHRFKEGYGARHVEYVGTYDFVVRPLLYKVFKSLNSIRWKVL